MRILSKFFALAAALAFAPGDFALADKAGKSATEMAERQEGCNTKQDYGYQPLRKLFLNERIPPKAIQAKAEEIYQADVDSKAPDLNGWGEPSLNDLKSALLKKMRDETSQAQLSITALMEQDLRRLKSAETRITHPALKAIIEAAKNGAAENDSRREILQFAKSISKKADAIGNLSTALRQDRRKMTEELRYNTDCPQLDPRI